MKSVKGVKWFKGKAFYDDVVRDLWEMYNSATLTLGESDRYEVKMIVSKPDGTEKSVVGQENYSLRVDNNG